MDTSQVTKQEQRTILRERFLRMVAAVNGQHADIKMQEKTRVSCDLGPIDLNVENLQVSNLMTPMGTLPHAVLRTSDVIGITIKDMKIDRG